MIDKGQDEETAAKETDVKYDFPTDLLDKIKALHAQEKALLIRRAVRAECRLDAALYAMVLMQAEIVAEQAPAWTPDGTKQAVYNEDLHRWVWRPDSLSVAE